jgi:hypothetical protein
MQSANFSAGEEPREPPVREPPVCEDPQAATATTQLTTARDPQALWLPRFPILSFQLVRATD